jgi:glyoxylase-like metal-dependent hydrolase (beta-lactamase superfamily II)
MTVPFVTDHQPDYGDAVAVTPLVRRVTANNPGKFTGWGTGTYIVGRGAVAIIDPGPDDADHVAAVLAAVAGEEVTHLVVTHTHRDHSPASRAMQLATGAPIYGFGRHPVADEVHATEAGEGDVPGEAQEEPGDLEFVPDIELSDGDVIAAPGFTLEALHTPGHISNHLCYALREERGLFTGDHVMGWSTTVIPPPDGSIADYRLSLERLLPRDDRIYWPTHGSAITGTTEFVRALLDHRRHREEQILGALAAGPRSIPSIVAELYADVRTELHTAAGRSVLAHLVDLEQRRLVTATSDEHVSTGSDPVGTSKKEWRLVRR